MQFLSGVVLFMVVIGAMDARLPWPSAKKEKRHPEHARRAFGHVSICVYFISRSVGFSQERERRRNFIGRMADEFGLMSRGLTGAKLLRVE